MQIDVVIPTCNTIKTKSFSLYYTIRSILSQSLQPKSILIVENETFELTKEKIEKEFGRLVSVIDGTSVPRNISYARNLGVKSGNGELILFMDDDVVVGRNHFFQTVYSLMEKLDFACGAYRYWTRTDWNEYLDKSYSISHIQRILKYKTYLPRSVERLTGNPSFHEYSFIGHFGVIKRAVFDKINGFDEDFKEWSYQDTDLMMRLCEGGFQYELLSNDDIFVYHLSHEVDKVAFQEINKNLFIQKQKKLGIKFRLNHFFGVFDDDSYAILR
jgi:GT2 family glycosyltransferase